MNAKFLLLSVLLLPVSGCSQDDREPSPVGDGNEPPDNVTTEQEWTFYLQWPDPCPADNAGNTTYEDPSNETQRTCGPSLADHVPEEVPCGRFMVHDRTFRIVRGDNLSTMLVITDGPGDVTMRFVWRDDNGVVGEAEVFVGLRVSRLPGAGGGSTVASRDSSGTLWFEV